MIRTLIVSLMVALLSVGCATKNDVKMVDAHYEAKWNHDVEQTEQVTVKAVEIGKIMVIECEGEAGDNPYCIALSAIMKKDAAEAIASIDTVEFKEKMPTLSLDVQQSLIDKGAKVMGGYLIVDGIKYALRQSGDTVGEGATVFKNKGDAVVGDGNTLSRTTTVDEQHATQTQVSKEGNNYGAPNSVGTSGDTEEGLNEDGEVADPDVETFNSEGGVICPQGQSKLYDAEGNARCE